jgi:uncharacterized membrane protein
MENNKTIFGLEQNVAALLFNILAPICCIGVVLSIIALIQEKNNSFVRFYAAQTIFLWLALFAFNLIVGFIFGMMLGVMRMPELSPLVSLGLAAIAFIIFIFVGIQAFGGKIFEVPVIGGIAKSVAGN